MLRTCTYHSIMFSRRFGNGDSDSENLVEMSFIAGSSQPITRTVLGSDGATVTWQTNDKIGIGFKGNQPKNYPFTTPTAGSDVHFWGKAPDVNNVSYFMMYPFSRMQRFQQTVTPKQYTNTTFQRIRTPLQAHLIQRRMYLLVSFHSVENHSLHTMLVVCSALLSKELQT